MKSTSTMGGYASSPDQNASRRVSEEDSRRKNSEAYISGGSREGDDVSDIGETGHKLNKTLKSKSKTGVRR